MEPTDQVQFEEQTSGFSSNVKLPTLNKWVVKLGLAKDYNSSNTVLVVIAIIAIVLAVGIYAYYVAGYNPFRGKPTTADYSKLSPELQNAMQQQQAKKQ